MDHPVRVAWCDIFFESNGGRFGNNGLPLLNEAEDIRGLCDNPFDCGACDLMITKLRLHVAEGWEVGWECESCVKSKDPEGIEKLVPGYFQAGRDPNSKDPFNGERDHSLAQLSRKLVREGKVLFEVGSYDNTDDDRPGMHASVIGCTSPGCGWQSSFLQLVLRRKTP